MAVNTNKVYFNKNKKEKKPIGTMDDMAENDEDIITEEESKAESTRSILRMLRKAGAPKKKDQL